MQKSGLLVGLGMTLAIASTPSLADMENGAKVAEQCVSCHGAKGISNSPLWPNLQGQKVTYMIKQLRDFKSGARKDPMMNLLAQALSDKDMADVSVYFANLE